MAKAKTDELTQDEQPQAGSVSWSGLVARHRSFIDLKIVNDFRNPNLTGANSPKKGDVKTAVSAYLNAHADELKSLESDTQAWVDTFEASNPDERLIQVVKRHQKATEDFKRFA